MPNTFTLIASTSAPSGSVADLSFSSIPNTYTDLKVVLSIKGANSSFQGTTLRFNGTSSGYTDIYLQGDGSSVASGSNVNGGTGIYIGAIPGTTQTSIFANIEIYIPNYTSSNNKSVSIDQVSEANATQSFSAIIAGLWSNSAAITSISIAASSGNLAQYSTAYLYGIIKS